ncbi:MAG: DUF1993 domain-containing protein [Sphingomonadaceae bacterium]|nr:DUF1993 domain-containing protein [Sphingomonadaceae bacterium]
MPLSLHAAFVPSALQMIGTTRHLVDKGEEWCAANSVADCDLIGCRLIDDMFAFDYQVKSVAVHTAGAVAGAKAGEFAPDLNDPPNSFDGLRAKLDEATAKLEALTVDELEGLMGQNVNFVFRGKTIMSFTAEDFLLSFSQPNFYFHAATAYDILRMKGAQVGKVDFLGRMRGTRPA